MKRMTAVLSAAAVVVLTVGVFAQAKPNFSGTWVMQAPAEDTGAGAMGRGRGGGRGGFGQEATITQNATTLTIKYTQGQNPVTLVYKLDGSESTNEMTTGRGTMTQTSKAVWQGAKLAITTTTNFGEQTRTLSLDGGKLMIEMERPGRNGGDPTTSTVTYTKK